MLDKELRHYLDLIDADPEAFVADTKTIIAKAKSNKKAMELLLIKISEISKRGSVLFKPFVDGLKNHFATDSFATILYYYYVLEIFPESKKTILNAIKEPVIYVLEYEDYFFSNKILGGIWAEKNVLGVTQKECLVEWLLLKYGLEAIPLIKHYKQKNDALRMIYYETVDKYLGKIALPILVKDGLLYNFDFSTEYGFMTFEKYVRQLMSLISKYDFSEYYGQIHTHFMGLKNKGVGGESNKIGPILKYMEYKMV